MTVTVIIMIIVGIVICIVSFFVSEHLSEKKENMYLDLMTVDEDYEFSERELRIIKRKIEDVIANQAKDILYETNESLGNMANEKTLALGDYAVAVCEEIEKNHKEVMFLYSMLDDKQKEIMKTVRIVNDANKEAKAALDEVKRIAVERVDNKAPKKQSAIEQLSALSQRKNETNSVVNAAIVEDAVSPQHEDTQRHTTEMSSVVMPEENVDATDVAEAETTYDDTSFDEGVDNMEDVFAEIDQTDIDFDDALEEEFKENENSNDIILEMHRNGNSIIEIAKQLGLGVGEVKLVIDLYKGE